MRLFCCVFEYHSADRILVLSLKHLLHDKVTLLELQLLAILAHHYRLVLIERVRREISQQLVGVAHQLGLPLNWEVVIVVQCATYLLEMRLVLFIRPTRHLGDTLETAALIDREDQINILRASSEEIIEPSRGRRGGRPHTVLARYFQMVHLARLHNEEACLWIERGFLVDAPIPIVITLGVV